MDNTMNSERYLKTKSIYQASYVLAKGGEMAGIDVNSDGVYFSFVRSVECERIAEEFNNAAEAMVDARVYVSALQMLYRERQEQLMKAHAREDKA